MAERLGRNRNRWAIWDYCLFVDPADTAHNVETDEQSEEKSTKRFKPVVVLKTPEEDPTTLLGNETGQTSIKLKLKIGK